MKIKERHRRDFWAYVRFNRRCNGRFGNPYYFCPDAGSVLVRGSVDTVCCFVEYDSVGRMPGQPREPRLFKLALDGKKLVNFHIEQWVEGLAEGTLIPWELRFELFDLPDWVGIALHRQWLKLVAKG